MDEFSAEGDLVDGRFNYAGPSILEFHGQAQGQLAQYCLEEVKNSDVVFVWVDTADTVGTLVEIGAAHARGKPIFIAFATRELASQFYFARQLASVALVVPDAVALSGAIFRNWQDQG